MQRRQLINLYGFRKNDKNISINMGLSTLADNSCYHSIVKNPVKYERNTHL